VVDQQTASKPTEKYYKEARTHLSLHKDAPILRAVHTAGARPLTESYRLFYRKFECGWEGAQASSTISRTSRKACIGAPMTGFAVRTISPRRARRLA
jgi:hypothetical protein